MRSERLASRSLPIEPVLRKADANTESGEATSPLQGEGLASSWQCAQPANLGRLRRVIAINNNPPQEGEPPCPPSYVSRYSRSRSPAPPLPAAGAAQSRHADNPPPPTTITVFEGKCILDHNGYDPCHGLFPTVEHDDFTYPGRP